MLIIYNNRVETENANIPHGKGPINPKNFTPFPKNPLIAKFFIQLGRVDELGSGVLNVNKYIKQYAGKDSPKFIEGDVFKMQIPIPKVDGVTEGVSQGLSKDFQKAIMELIYGIALVMSRIVKHRLGEMVGYIYSNPGCKFSDVRDKIGLSDRTIRDNMKILLDNNIVVYKGSKRTGGYYLSEEVINDMENETR